MEWDILRAKMTDGASKLHHDINDEIQCALNLMPLVADAYVDGEYWIDFDGITGASFSPVDDHREVEILCSRDGMVTVDFPAGILVYLDAIVKWPANEEIQQAECARDLSAMEVTTSGRLTVKLSSQETNDPELIDVVVYDVPRKLHFGRIAPELSEDGCI